MAVLMALVNLIPAFHASIAQALAALDALQAQSDYPNRHPDLPHQCAPHAESAQPSLERLSRFGPGYESFEKERRGQRRAVADA